MINEFRASQLNQLASMRDSICARIKFLTKKHIDNMDEFEKDELKESILFRAQLNAAIECFRQN